MFDDDEPNIDPNIVGSLFWACVLELLLKPVFGNVVVAAAVELEPKIVEPNDGAGCDDVNRPPPWGVDEGFAVVVSFLFED